jgi:opacity protein-like surface antigen
MKKLIILLAAAAVACSAALAQDAPKVEVYGDYSYIYATPQNNNYIKSFALNGGGGGFAAYFTKYIGIEGDFQGYGSYTHSATIPPPFCNGPCIVKASGNLFTYNVGPIVKYRTPHFEPFVETMFGGAHSNLDANLYQQCQANGCSIASKAPSNNAFDFIIGGGLDVPLSPRFAIRPAQFDYVLTRFGNDFTHGNNNQSNFRFQAGVEFRIP